MEVTSKSIYDMASRISVSINISSKTISTDSVRFLYRAIIALKMIESGKYKANDPRLNSNLQEAVVEFKDNCVEELLSIVSSEEVINLIIKGNFPKYLLCFQCVQNNYSGFIDNIKRTPNDKMLINSIKAIVNDEVFFNDDGVRKCFSLRGSVVQFSTQTVNTMSGNIVLVSTSISSLNSEDVKIISKRILEYLKEEKEKGTTFIFSDSSGFRTFSGLDIEFVDLGVRHALNLRTNNTINVKFI